MNETESFPSFSWTQRETPTGEEVELVLQGPVTFNTEKRCLTITFQGDHLFHLRFQRYVSRTTRKAVLKIAHPEAAWMCEQLLREAPFKRWRCVNDRETCSHPFPDEMTLSAEDGFVVLHRSSRQGA